MALLSGDFGVRVVVQYCPLYRYPMFARAGMGDAECPESERFFDNMVSFPFHHWMPEDQFETMIEFTQAALSRLRGERIEGAPWPAPPSAAVPWKTAGGPT
jgi:dTDP-4-amino-4,6-dideoxygalactose transaminase